MKRVIALLGGVVPRRRRRVVGAGRGAAPDRPCTTLDPMGFVSSIDNPYYPLPVGRTLVYRGVRDGNTQVDRVTGGS